MKKRDGKIKILKEKGYKIEIRQNKKIEEEKSIKTKKRKTENLQETK